MPAPRYDRALVWFRRDLRSEDHAALHHALSAARGVFCAFVFDSEILDALPSRQDRRVEFIWEALAELRAALEALGGGLLVLHGRAREEIPALAQRLQVQAVFANHDYEPQAIGRDLDVERRLQDSGIAFHTGKDQAIFEKDELLTQGGRPFSVFTPYKNAWLKKVDDAALRERAVAPLAGRLAPPPPSRLPDLSDIGFARTNLEQLRLPLGMRGAHALLDEFRGRIHRYREQRDFPAVRGPSYLSAHLRFGTISVRTLARAARERGDDGAQTWLSELIWRDFYFQILYHHPHVVGHAFKPEFDRLAFPNDETLFRAWCEARTGYPLVDAAMRQINQTGYMHNRLRMVAASFLVKDLHVDWRWGERYFARHLTDFDLAANNGGWQWAASTGCDAQPWFRIFNPVTQSEKFDPQGRFIRLYLPELERVPDRHIHAPWQMTAAEQDACGVWIGTDYPAPVVDHAAARAVTLALYGKGAAA
jgi:deoxyribodipyrimidine photo-lyase